ncbi:MAG: ATP-binding protein [Actinobacteria bacterium]|nr:ATP-binding protein [Actinomycetota bacterium]
MADEEHRAARPRRHVLAEFRGDVCVVRWGGGSDGDLAADLRAELETCRASGAADIVLDVAPSVALGGDEVRVLQELATTFHLAGGEFVVVVEEPAARAVLAEAGLVRPPLPHPAPLAAGQKHISLPAKAGWEHEFTFSASTEALPTARRRVTAFAEVAGLRGSDLFEFSVAVAEALANALVHGSPHGIDDDIRVRFFCYDDEVAVEVADGGGGLDATPTCVPEALASSGRGIHFMRALCDAVQFTCGPLGTHVLLVKRRE